MTRRGRLPWRHHVCEETQTVWVVVHSHTTAMGAGTITRRIYPGYVVRYCTDAYMNHIEEGRFLF